MSAAQRIQLSQERESQVESRQGPRFGYRYAYARSADTQSSGDRGQDYVALVVDETRLAFALCDGVSQSFVGDLAARLLGDALLEWLWTKLNVNQDEAAITEGLVALLRQLTQSATEQVKTYTLSPDIVPMVRGVLEQKRALGSESTFVCGVVDTAAGQLFVAWMGDSRLRLWGEGGEWVDRLDPNTFQTRERWSSRDGPVGELHVARMSLQGLVSVAAYSDGLAVMEDRPAPALGDAELDEVIAATGQHPKSDDVSFVEIWLGQRKPMMGALPAPTGIKVRPKDQRVVIVSWEPVTGAEEYEIQLEDQPGSTKVSSLRWAATLDQLPPGSPACRVRARRGAAGGPWSEAVPLPKRGGESEGERVVHEIILPGTPRDRPKRRQWRLPALIGALLVICLVGSVVGALLLRERLWSLLGAPTPTATITVAPAATKTLTGTLTPSLTSTATASATLTQTATPTASPTDTPTDTPTPTATFSVTATATDTATATPTATVTPSQAPEGTP